MCRQLGRDFETFAAVTNTVLHANMLLSSVPRCALFVALFLKIPTGNEALGRVPRYVFNVNARIFPLLVLSGGAEASSCRSGAEPSRAEPSGGSVFSANAAVSRGTWRANCFMEVIRSPHLLQTTLEFTAAQTVPRHDLIDTAKWHFITKRDRKINDCIDLHEINKMEYIKYVNK